MSVTEEIRLAEQAEQAEQAKARNAALRSFALLAQDDAVGKRLDANKVRDVFKRAGKSADDFQTLVEKIRARPGLMEKTAAGDAAPEWMKASASSVVQAEQRFAEARAAWQRAIEENEVTQARGKGVIRVADAAERQLDEIDREVRSLLDPSGYAEQLADEEEAKAARLEASGLDHEVRNLMAQIAPGSDRYADLALARRNASAASISEDPEREAKALAEAEKRFKDIQDLANEKREAAEALRSGKRPPAPTAVVREKSAAHCEPMATVPL